MYILISFECPGPSLSLHDSLVPRLGVSFNVEAPVREAIRMKLQPAVWGPFFWHTIHIAALAYPTQPTYAHKRAAKEFYESLVHLIPCPICKEHYQVHLQKFPLTPHLDRRADLFKWTVLLHNEVNKSLGKPIVSELEALAFYRRIGARGVSPVINQEYIDEVDIRSMIKGGFIGGGIVLAVGAAIWWANKGEMGSIATRPLSF